MADTKKTREEPKFNVDDFEKKSDLYKKKWPKDEVELGEVPEEVADVEIAGILEHPSYLELEKKLTDLEIEFNDSVNQKIRAQAELDNVRRRAERDVISARKYALEAPVSDLLPVIDSMYRALTSDVGDNQYAKKIHEGIELTLSLLLKTLEKYGVKQIDPLEEPFNPELHQAIATREGDVASNIVIEVLQKGYLLHDRLIRPALVVVSA